MTQRARTESIAGHPLMPLGRAVAEEPEIRAACAWWTATPAESELRGAVVPCLGLILADGAAEADFDRLRAAVRERAVRLGMPSTRPYASAQLDFEAPHWNDAAHVVRIKTPAR